MVLDLALNLIRSDLLVTYQQIKREDVLVLKRFKKRVQKKTSSDQESNIVIDVAELEPKSDPSVQMSEENPYQNQIQLLYEKSLLDDPDLESAHNLSKWLMEHPEFLPDPSNDEK